MFTTAYPFAAFDPCHNSKVHEPFLASEQVTLYVTTQEYYQTAKFAPVLSQW